MRERGRARELETALAFSSMCLAESQEHVGRPIALSVGNAVVIAAAKKNEKRRKRRERTEKGAKKSRRRRYYPVTLQEASKILGNTEALMIMHCISASRKSWSEFLPHLRSLLVLAPTDIIDIRASKLKFRFREHTSSLCSGALSQTKFEFKSMLIYEYAKPMKDHPASKVNFPTTRQRRS